MSVYKIAVVGPESTGKTLLSEELASYYKMNMVREVAREYLNNLNRTYDEADLLQIAKLQCLEEDRLTPQNGLLICDTTLLVIKIWSLVKYGRCNDYILEELNNRNYSLQLLCNIDLPWEPDPLREHPEMREALFNMYHQELMKSHSNFEIVTGSHNRLSNAIYYIDRNISLI